MLERSRRFLSPRAACVLAAFTAGCAATGTAVAPIDPAAQSAGVEAVAKANLPLLFVGDSNNGTIDVFTVHNAKYTLEYQIHDDNGPEGLHTDTAGNLYVADQGIGSESPGVGDIDVYAPGSAGPYRTIFPGYNISDVVSAPNGSLYASNFGPDGYFGPGSASVYKPKSDVPTRTMGIPSAFQALSIVRDAKSHDVFATYSKSDDSGHIARFADGKPPAMDLGVSYSTPWGIAEDGSGHLLVAAGSAIQIYSQKGKQVGSFAVPGIAYRLAFNTDRSLLFATNFNNFDVEIFAYPKGNLVGSIKSNQWTKYAWPDGVAFWPPPK
jgi:hypothetical protein